MVNKKKKILIIGGGFAGCASARILIKLSNIDITLVEKSSVLGAGVRTNYYGGHPYTFGPRHFLTHNKLVYEYLNKIVPMRSCGDHQFITYVEKDNNFYNYPMHVDDIKKMPDRSKVKKELKHRNLEKIKNSKNLEEYWINSMGKTLYSKTIADYNKKMWLVNDNKKIDTFNWSPKGATLKSGPRAAWDKAISAYPIKENGYNDFFDKLDKRIKVKLKSEVKIINLKKKIVSINNKKPIKFDIIISSISPDFFFNKKYGELKFIGRDFHKIVMPTENVFPKNVYFLYYANDEKFTRIVEYKKFTKHKSKTSLLGMEIPSKNGKHYPLPFKKEIKKAQRYLKELPEWIFSIGRAGTYRYEVDIDDSIEQALEIKKIIMTEKYDNCMPIKKWWKV